MVKKFEELDRIPDAVILKVNQIALKFESFYLKYSKHVHKALSCQLASFRDGLSWIPLVLKCWYYHKPLWLLGPKTFPEFDQVYIYIQPMSGILVKESSGYTL